jgi:hypothetical protein
MLVPLWSIIRNRLKETAEHRGIPTFIVADAGRTQVSFMLLWIYLLWYVKLALLVAFTKIKKTISF